MSEEEPPVPEPLPAIPLLRLWGSLLVPPLLTAAFTVAYMQLPGDTLGREGPLLVSPLSAFTILPCMVQFIAAVSPRYRGMSFTLLGWGFAVGQMVICSVAGLASYFLVLLFTRQLP